MNATTMDLIKNRIGLTAPLGVAGSALRNGRGEAAGAQFAAMLALSTSRAPSLPDVPTKGEGAQPMLAPAQATAPSHNVDLSVHERALGLRAYRQEMLASNIANADTPGYRAVDFDINAAVRGGYSGSNKPPLQYRPPSQPSADGNIVDLDTERVQFAQNALMYEFTLDRVKGHYKEMDDLLKGTPF